MYLFLIFVCNYKPTNHFFSMNYKIFPLFLLFLMSFSSKEIKTIEPQPNQFPSSKDSEIEMLYHTISTTSFNLPEMNCFKQAAESYYSAKEKGLINKDIITIIDFSISSTQKRLWVIDMATHIVLYNTLVSHGIKSGEEFADSFSNVPNSNKSSLGLYITAETYTGIHGLSLKLDGQEQGINDMARRRAIVVHGASYSNQKLVEKQGYLGRSQGCPAIPEEFKKDIINTIKDKSCLYIYHSSKENS